MTSSELEAVQDKVKGEDVTLLAERFVTLSGAVMSGYVGEVVPLLGAKTVAR
jgi:hypothetical protein